MKKAAGSAALKVQISIKLSIARNEKKAREIVQLVVGHISDYRCQDLAA
jgi:hypothetical protein